MPSPFPGMDPFLEEPELWPDVHISLLVALRDELVRTLPREYAVTADLRVYEVPLTELGAVPPTDLGLVGAGDVLISSELRPAHGPNGHGRPNGQVEVGERPHVVTVALPRPVEVRERYLEIRRARNQPDAGEVITVVEVISPTNKRKGVGRETYEKKRLALAGTQTNLVEIDLLRAGEPLPVLDGDALLPRSRAGDYRVVVSRGARRHRADLYPIPLREPLPPISIPLRPEDEEPTIPLQMLLDTLYDRGGFDRLISYQPDPVPPLDPEDAAWADALLREKGLRSKG